MQEKINIYIYKTLTSVKLPMIFLGWRNIQFPSYFVWDAKGNAQQNKLKKKKKKTQKGKINSSTMNKYLTGGQREAKEMKFVW